MNFHFGFFRKTQNNIIRKSFSLHPINNPKINRTENLFIIKFSQSYKIFIFALIFPKMKNLTLFFLLISISIFPQKFQTPYEQKNGNQTVTYVEMVKFYTDLDKKFKTITVENFGKDDNGEPIKVVIFNNSKDKSIPTILINNGIHPGEPDGIDATMMLMRDLATGKIETKNLQIVAVQSYNISGMLRRGKFSRANQNGPEEYGFRGNARNFDLNRDFIKNDTENAKAFQQIFHHFKPIYFIDNHVSNGADYQYLFTYISTNKERLGKI